MGIIDFFKRKTAPISKRWVRHEETDLFDDEFQRKLDYLALVSRKVFSGAMRAERRTKKTGSGVEFTDYRDYIPGDDFRNLDWHAYQRLDKLLIRLYEEEEDLSIYFIVDTSHSMSFHDGEKWKHAKRLCAALAYVGLANLDRITIVTGDSDLSGRMPTTRGKSRIFRVFQFLEKTKTAGMTDLGDVMKSFVSQHKRKGLAVLLTDLYDPKGFENGLNILRYQKFDPYVIHLTDQRDRHLKLKGDVRIYDCETGEERDVTMTQSMDAKYRLAYDNYMDTVRRFCSSHQVSYFRADVKVPFDELILRVFRQGGFLR